MFKPRTIAVVLLAACCFLEAQPSSKALVIQHVTVIDATGAAPMPDMTVVIFGNRIADIGKSGAVKIPDDAEVVDAHHKFLIPGLWDMHVHIFDYATPAAPRENFFPLMIANGITSIRELWTKPADIARIKEWRMQLNQGRSLPRIVSAGTLIDGPDPIWPGEDIVETPEEARQMVHTLRTAGIDFVKVYWNLPRDTYFAIANECRETGIPFAGHVPFSINAAEASAAGQRSIEHLTEILLSCSGKEEELREIDSAVWDAEQEQQIIDSYDPAKCEKLFSRFVENNTWQVPTLVIFKKFVMGKEDFLKDSRLEFMPAETRKEWESFAESWENRTPEEKTHGKLLWQANLKLTGAMHRAGVRFMAGTDSGSAVSYIYPGFSLHDELSLLVEAGFTPMEAVQAATRNPAEFSNRLDSIGTIEKGKTADLLILDADPLKDIRNTRKISAVVLNGKLLTHDSLSRMLQHR